MNKIGAVVIAYFFGLVIGNSMLMPDNAEALQESFTEVSVLLAIPLLLFSTNIKQWFKIAGKTMLSGILVTVSVVALTVTGYFLFAADMENGNKVAGMLTGVYTGGTPNMAAIKTALEADSDLYIITHTYDMVVCAFFLLLTLTVFRQLTSLFLKPFKLHPKNAELSEKYSETEDLESYEDIFEKKNMKGVFKGTAISLLVLVAAWASSLLVGQEYATLTAILVLTALGIALSLFPKVHNIPKTYQTGMYFILIFSLTVSSMADLDKIEEISEQLFYYVLFVVSGITFLNFLLSYIFKIDRDTALITMTSLIFSPPFVPVVAAKLNNKNIVLSGLTVGIIGYAAGTYLGILVAYLLL
jgi:uncharacterized membrane protein